MIGDDQRNLHRQLAAARSPQQIQQAMVLFAHQDGNPRKIIGEVKLRLSAQAFSQGVHGGPDGLPRRPNPQTPFDPA